MIEKEYTRYDLQSCLLKYVNMIKTNNFKYDKKIDN